MRLLEDTVKIRCPHDRSFSIARLDRMKQQEEDGEETIVMPRVMTYTVSSGDFREAAPVLDGPYTEDDLYECGIYEVCLSNEAVIRCSGEFLFLTNDWANTIPASEIQDGVHLAAVLRKYDFDVSYRERYVQHELTVAGVHRLSRKTGRKYYHFNVSGRSYYYCIAVSSGLSIIGRS